MLTRLPLPEEEHSKGVIPFPLQALAQCGISLQHTTYKCTAASRLHAILKDEIGLPSAAMDEVYVYDFRSDGLWSCRVQLPDGCIPGAISANVSKGEARETASAAALVALAKHKDYFRHFLLKVPPPGNLNPIATLINFFTSQSKFKDKLDFSYNVEGTTCTVKFRGYELGVAVGETKKQARDFVARVVLERLTATVAGLTPALLA